MSLYGCFFLGRKRFDRNRVMHAPMGQYSDTTAATLRISSTLTWSILYIFTYSFSRSEEQIT